MNTKRLYCLPATGLSCGSRRRNQRQFILVIGIVVFLLSIPRPSFSQIPIACGQTITNALSAVGESDIYTFNASAGEVVTLSAHSITGTVCAAMDVYDPASTWIGSVDCNIPFTFRVTTSGTYTVYVYDGGPSKYYDTGTYAVTLQFRSGRCGTPISCGQTITNNIAFPSQIQAYSFDANAGEAVMISAHSLTGGLCAAVALYDPAGNSVYGVTCDTTFRDPAVLTTNGTYTVFVYDAGAGSMQDTGPYALSLQFTTGRCGVPISCGQTVTNSIAFPGEMDPYVFAGTAGEVVIISAHHTGGSLCAAVELYDPAGDLVGWWDCDGPTPLWGLPETGPYTVLIHDGGEPEFYDTGSYAVGLQVLSNGCLSALNCGQTVTNTIRFPGEVQAYTFTALDGEQVLLALRHLSGNLCAAADIYDPSYQLVGWVDCDTGFRLATVSTGTYTVVVHDGGANPDEDTGDYALSLQFATGRCATPITCGQTITNSISLPTQIDAYTFNGNAGEVVILSPHSMSGNLCALAVLFDPTGGNIGGVDCNTSSAPIALPTTGAYTILLFAGGSAPFQGTGSYALTLLFTTGRCGTPIGCGQTITNAISFPGEADAYAFSGNAGEVITISPHSISGSLCAAASIWDPANNRISAVDCNVASTNIALATTGTYTVFVFDGGPVALQDTGSYSLLISCSGHPSVSIVATDPNASEQGPDPGTFTMARAGVTNGPLTAFYTISGTASNGVDYATLTGSVTIPAGAFTAAISISPLPDSLVEGNETVNLTITSNSFYFVGMPSFASLTIHDKSFDEWRFNKFTPAERANPAISGETADPDGDGIPNLLEYALNLEPKIADVGGLPKMAVQGGYLTLTYTEVKAAIDIVYAVQAAGEVSGSWSSSGLVETSRIDNGTTWRVTVRDSVPISVASHRFMRLRVTRL